jgi:ankyrin repeat protein
MYIDSREELFLFLNHEADVNIRTNKGYNILMRLFIPTYEFSKSNLPFLNLDFEEKDVWVKNLITSGININARDINGKNSLMHAIINEKSYNNWDSIKTLINNGVNINAQDEEGKTALMHIILNTGEDYEKILPSESKSLINYFLDNGADANITDKDNKKAVDYARENKYLNDTEVIWRLNDLSY